MGEIDRPSNSKERNLCTAFFHWEILGYLFKMEKELSDILSNSEAKFKLKRQEFYTNWKQLSKLDIKITTVNELKPKPWGSISWLMEWGYLLLKCDAFFYTNKILVGKSPVHSLMNNLINEWS